MSDLQRENFEKWVDSLSFTQLDDLCERSAWIAWQAAIKSVVIELPEPHQDEWKDLNLSIDEVKKAHDDAGVKYVLPDTFVRY